VALAERPLERKKEKLSAVIGIDSHFIIKLKKIEGNSRLQ
jgi:hypothetical protein